MSELSSVVSSRLASDGGRPPLVRTGLAGVLMGLANLVPGVSGGTMVLVMGLYPRFIDAVAGVSSLKLTRHRLVFLGLLVLAALVSVVGFATLMTRLVVEHRAVMYCLFIGLTLAGVPALYAMVRPFRWPAVVALLIGVGVMVGIRLSEDPEARERVREARNAEDFRPSVNYGTDLLAGAVAMSAMVLPGISGAHMMLVLGRYESVTGSISMAKQFVTSGGQSGDPAVFLGVLLPVGIGAILAMVLLSNLLKWLLKHYQRTMAGGLLGILLGSAIAIWPLDGRSTTGEVAAGVAAMLAGFTVVTVLSRLVGRKSTSDPA